MPTTRYTSTSDNSAISSVDFYANSFGRKDARLYINAEAAGDGTLDTLLATLKEKKITAYADIHEGEPTIVAYGFRKPERLLDVLGQSGAMPAASAPETFSAEGEKKSTGLRQFVQRHAIRLASVSGLLGHAMMGALAWRTGEKSFFATASFYGTADAVIARYGTDKSVKAEPLMQDFKHHLWKQGEDNSFVITDTDKISTLQSADRFMHKYGFQIGNAFGASGNVGMVVGGFNQKDGFMTAAGLTSLLGAAMQIFGTEQQLAPDEKKRRSIIARLFNFVNANPMQVAAATNLADPLMLTLSAVGTNDRNLTKIAKNTKQIHELRQELFDPKEAKALRAGHTDLSDFDYAEAGFEDTGLLVGVGGNTTSFAEKSRDRTALDRMLALEESIGHMDVKQAAVGTPAEDTDMHRVPLVGPFAATAREYATQRGMGTEKAELKAAKQAVADGSLYAGENPVILGKDMGEEEIKQASDKLSKIDSLQNGIGYAEKGGKTEPWIRGGGSRILRWCNLLTSDCTQNSQSR